MYSILRYALQRRVRVLETDIASFFLSGASFTYFHPYNPAEPLLETLCGFTLSVVMCVWDEITARTV